jgi:hypothetical protein
MKSVKVIRGIPPMGLVSAVAAPTTTTTGTDPIESVGEWVSIGM